jgi:hypothetical protein
MLLGLTYITRPSVVNVSPYSVASFINVWGFTCMVSLKQLNQCVNVLSNGLP